MKKKRSKKQETAPLDGDRQDPPTDEAVESAEGINSSATAPPTAAEPEPDAPIPPEPETVPLERLLRLQADFDNYRKRMARDQQALTERATEDLMLELLPVLDNFDIALQHAEEKPVDPAVVKGFRLVAEHLGTALKKFGLQPVPADGLPFDPHRHEAVAHGPDPERPEGMITAQTRRGYQLGDRLLRAAQVVVSSGPPETELDGGGNAQAQEE